MIRHYDAPFKIKAWESFIFTLLGSCESKREALSQTNRAVRTRQNDRRDPTGSNKPDSDSASRPSGETRGKSLSGDAAAHRNLNRFIVAFVEAFPIETRRGGCCVRKPVQHDVIQHLIASERILGISMAIGPSPEFFENPGGLPSR